MCQFSFHVVILKFKEFMAEAKVKLLLITLYYTSQVEVR